MVFLESLRTKQKNSKGRKIFGGKKADLKISMSKITRVLY